MAKILYGLPNDTDELKCDLDAKRVVFGGCAAFRSVLALLFYRFCCQFAPAELVISHRWKRRLVSYKHAQTLPAATGLVPASCRWKRRLVSYKHARTLPAATAELVSVERALGSYWHDEIEPRLRTGSAELGSLSFRQTVLRTRATGEWLSVAEVLSGGVRCRFFLCFVESVE